MFGEQRSSFANRGNEKFCAVRKKRGFKVNVNHHRKCFKIYHINKPLRWRSG